MSRTGYNLPSRLAVFHLLFAVEKKIILWPEFKLCKLILILELQVFKSWVLEKKFSFPFSHTDPTSTSNMEINKSEMRIIKISKINPYGTS